MFSIKVADTHTDTSTDNKGRLKLAAREPIKVSGIDNCHCSGTSTKCCGESHGKKRRERKDLRDNIT